MTNKKKAIIYSPIVTMTDPRYNRWLEANKDDMLNMWESMGIVERHEEGGDFDTFCSNQYHDGYGS